MVPDTKLASLMTEKVIWVRPGETLERVGELFDSHAIHHIPVVDEGGRIVGMISKSDYEKVSHALTAFNQEKYIEYNRSIHRSLLASELMTKQVARLSPQDSVYRAAEYFRENLFRAIPLVDEDNKLIGIVTTYDLLNYAYQESNVQ